MTKEELNHLNVFDSLITKWDHHFKIENILNYLYIIIAFVLAISLSYFILPRILLISYKKKLFDEIDDRKIHTQQIPRLGGVCFPLIVLLILLLISGVRYI